MARKNGGGCVWKCGEASFFLDFFFGSFLLYPRLTRQILCVGGQEDKRNELKA
jgi:hypothetical protein